MTGLSYRDVVWTYENTARTKEAALIVSLIFDLLVSAIGYALAWSGHLTVRSRIMALVLSGHGLDLASCIVGVAVEHSARFVHVGLGIVAVLCDASVAFYRIMEAVRCNDGNEDSCMYADAGGVYVDFVGAFFIVAMLLVALSNIFLCIAKTRATTAYAAALTNMSSKATGAPAAATATATATPSTAAYHDVTVAGMRSRVPMDKPLTFNVI